MHHNWTPERLEKKAISILSEYKDGELLKAPAAMNVDDFAEYYCNATIDFANLSQDGKTLGSTCFSDGKLMVWDDDRKYTFPIDVKTGYIFVDNSLMKSEMEERIRFTIIHECSHYLIHKHFYYIKPGTVMPKIECTIYHVEKWSQISPMSDYDIREWQANRLGAALIMPSITVKMQLSTLLRTECNIFRCSNYISDTLIQRMASVYRVSKSAMRNRLRDLNLLNQ
jgi:hypothetical protein